MRTILAAMLLVTAPAVAQPTGSIPDVLIQEFSMRGGLVEPKLMQRAFDSISRAASRCHGRASRNLEPLDATVTVNFEIDDSGAVESAAAAGLASVNDCLAKEIKAVVFAPPSYGAMLVTAKLLLHETRTARMLGSTRLTKGGAFVALRGDDVSEADLSAAAPGRSNAAVPSVAIGQITAQGGLDKASVHKGLKRVIQRFQYCYEKQLLTTRTLAGTVQTKFTIDGEGKVSAATADGVDAEVASCVADVIRNVAFPKPRGGGVVEVSCALVVRPN